MLEQTADVAPDAVVGATSRVWGLAQVGAGARIGEECVVGRGATIDAGVVLGDRVKVQAGALVYRPAVLEDGVFIGPAAVLTNDLHPRAVDPDGQVKTGADWTPVAVVVRRGASVGARAVCVAPVTIGRWAMVAAGAVVTRDVPDFALVAGVPARRIGWVGPSGHRLSPAGEGAWTCPVTGQRFVEVDDQLRETS
ncbi:N-acetyltransferase [Nocardioides sp. HDW12B]|uniref:acyltransferase n=1 Tax=Nocardioides sp. HDW12B TaxID=2714939 RepID=UPI0014085EAC|nr:acyltransferase [Nocardioides sp. HDW12B]QIK66059.1 N-acetyltransferase [Nocardioides sp. HDW12B]